MTETIVSSATREVVIGFDRPFVIIGERMMTNGRSKPITTSRVAELTIVSVMEPAPPGSVFSFLSCLGVHGSNVAIATF